VPTVELYGQARLLAGQKALDLDARSIRDALTQLASRYPQLIGTVLQSDGGLTSAYALNLNGIRFTGDLDEPLATDDALLVISSLSGG
jgi:sulfur-carrier protein